MVYILNFTRYFQISHIKQNVSGENDVRERRYMSQDEKGWGSIIVEYGTRMWAPDPRPYVSYVFLKQTCHNSRIARNRVSSYLDPPVKITKRLDTS